ncbi:MAG: hypothetical protein QG664_760 [Patescibacteria group bacterium]|nr:hypothetical protein [Patescibacteria group bacterium]
MHLEKIEYADDDVFEPVEKHNSEERPSEKHYSKEWDEIRYGQGPLADSQRGFAGEVIYQTRFHV